MEKKVRIPEIIKSCLFPHECTLVEPSQVSIHKKEKGRNWAMILIDVIF